jgi:hypothetical protein
MPHGLEKLVREKMTTINDPSQLRGQYKRLLCVSWVREKRPDIMKAIDEQSFIKFPSLGKRGRKTKPLPAWIAKLK